MPTIKYLKEQMERARRFAESFTNIADRERFHAVAEDYQHQIDATPTPSNEAQGASPEPRSEQPSTIATTGEAPAVEVASADETPTTATGEQPETD